MSAFGGRVVFNQDLNFIKRPSALIGLVSYAHLSAFNLFVGAKGVVRIGSWVKPFDGLRYTLLKAAFVNKVSF